MIRPIDINEARMMSSKRIMNGSTDTTIHNINQLIIKSSSAGQFEIRVIVYSDDVEQIANDYSKHGYSTHYRADRGNTSFLTIRWAEDVINGN